MKCRKKLVKKWRFRFVSCELGVLKGWYFVPGPVLGFKRPSATSFISVWESFWARIWGFRLRWIGFSRRTNGKKRKRGVLGWKIGQADRKKRKIWKIFFKRLMKCRKNLVKKRCLGQFRSGWACQWEWNLTREGVFGWEALEFEGFSGCEDDYEAGNKLIDRRWPIFNTEGLSFGPKKTPFWHLGPSKTRY